MTVSLTHSTPADGTFSATGATAWNAEHVITAATNTLLGRQTAGTGAVEEITCTAAGRALLDDVDAAAQRTTLGLGTLATQNGTFSGTSSGTNTGDQNIFQTIAVSGQSNVVADSTSDTLTLVAGSNITITTNATTDTITIAATGGGGSSTAAIGYTINGGGTTITTGVAGNGLSIPFNATITAVTMQANTTGSIVIDIWKDSYANFPPTVADSICGSAKPTITSSNKSQNSTLTGWTTSISAGDILYFNVDSVASISNVVLTLTVTKT